MNRNLYRKKKNKEEWIANCSWDKYDEMDYQSKIKKYYETAYQKYKETDREYIVKAEEIMSKYTLPTVANAIGTLENCTEDFILNLFIPLLEVMYNQSNKELLLCQDLVQVKMRSLSSF